VFKAHILCVSLNSRLESNKEEERVGMIQTGPRKVQKVQLFGVVDQLYSLYLHRDIDWRWIGRVHVVLRGSCWKCNRSGTCRELGQQNGPAAD